VTHVALTRAARVLHQGGVIAYATEYCFGLGCDPLNRSAVARLLHIKRRSVHKGLILIAADTDQLNNYVEHIPENARASWPGPHTWLLTPRATVPKWITGRHDRLAVRVTAHPVAADLCRTFGSAIVSTSANRAGAKPTRDYRTTVHRFKDDLDYILPGRVGSAPAPTPIRDAVSGALIRAG